MSETMVPSPLRADDEYGRMTHIDRINGDGNPAAIPGIVASYGGVPIYQDAPEAATC